MNIVCLDLELASGYFKGAWAWLKRDSGDNRKD